LWPVRPTAESALRELDVIFLCCPPEVSLEVIRLVGSSVRHVVDGSSALRMDNSIPLVIPEINGQLLSSQTPVASNPNCTTTIALMALYPLHRVFGLKRFWATTYQAVSGIGKGGINELNSQLLCPERAVVQFFPKTIGNNIIPQVGNFVDDETEEEIKLRWESRKILSLSRLDVSATCVRVPVFRAHAIGLTAEFENRVSLVEAHKALTQFPGLNVHNTPGDYPTPLDYEGQVSCGIGRLRVDRALDNGLSLWVVGDQLLKGAAYNMLQIFKCMTPSSRGRSNSANAR
jgi:aspartate-semialdehyde dehydrogenase